MYRLDKLAAATFRTRKMFDQSCRACGSNENLQIHHVRKLKDSSRKIKMDYLTSMMARMNRKGFSFNQESRITSRQSTPSMGIRFYRKFSSLNKVSNLSIVPLYSYSNPFQFRPCPQAPHRLSVGVHTLIYDGQGV